MAAQSLWAQPQNKPIKRPDNNELELIDLDAAVRLDPPSAVVGTTSRLVFHTSPLSSKGLLSEQVRAALKALDKANGSATILKLRAFVAGTGDVRRVQSIVTEVFTGKKWPLPALTTIQVGGLPLENAQVVIEAISQEKKKEVNPGGLAFFSAQDAAAPTDAVAQLEMAMKAVEATPLRVTCFAQSAEAAEQARLASAKAFPRMPATAVQLTRYGQEPHAACEGIGRLPAKDAAGPLVSRMDVPGLQPLADRAPVVIVRRPQLVFTAAQMAFEDSDDDIRLAYQRLGRTIQDLGVSYDDVVFSHIYAINRGIEEKVSGLRADFINPELRPARTTEIFEGLPSLDASMAVEIVAAAK